MKRTKQKKIKKPKPSPLKVKRKSKKFSIDLEKEAKEFWASPQGISIKASAEGKPDPYARVINVYDEAAKVKNFKQLEGFLDRYSPGIDAALAAKILTRYTKDHWNAFRICSDTDYHSAIFELLHWIDTHKGGAIAAYNHRVLRRFQMLTGYKKPNTSKTFQNELTLIKDHFGLARKNNGAYKEKQLKEAAVRLAKKNSRLV